MTLYHCSLRNRAGEEIRSERVSASDDGEAHTLALLMMQDDSGVRSIIVWREADVAFRVNRFDLKAGGQTRARDPYATYPRT